MSFDRPKPSLEMINTQLGKIKAIELKVDEESKVLDSAIAERVHTLSELIGKTWMAQTFPDKYVASIDPLLTKKFRTKVGYSVIRLEKLLLELDQVDTLGDEELRARRRHDVKVIQELLRRAEELRKKANRLVDLQESLAALGKKTMREVLEAPAQPAQSPTSKEDEKPKKRRFASPVSGEKESDEALTSSQGDDESMDVLDTDSHEDLQEAQREKDQMVEDYYKSIKSSKSAMDVEKSKAKQDKQKDDDDETASKSQEKQEKSQKPTNGNNDQPKSKTAASLQKPVDEAHEDDLPEPKMSMKELPRAYVILVQDPMIRRARVSLDQEENALSVVVPGKSPLTFRLGSNINTRGITKEIQQDFMRIVLPKIAPAYMRTGRSFADTPFFPGFAMRDDFWSRF